MVLNPRGITPTGDGPTYSPFKQGKVKDVYVNGDELLFDFTNRISVFDKVIPSDIARKGESLCRTTEYWFKKFDLSGLCQTHYIRRVAPNQMIVRRADIKENPTVNDTNYFIPLEFICRYYAAGSLVNRMEKGKMKPEEVGLTSVPKVGDKLPEPYFEATTKFEPVDRSLTPEEAMKIAGLTPDDFNDIKNVVLGTNEIIQKKVGSRGLIYVDGKKEFSFVDGRELMLVDTLGTGDEDRFWDEAEHKKGNIKDLSKEFVRQYYIETGYKEKLDEARDNEQPEPDIPALPDSIVQETSDLYARLHTMLTGEQF